MVEGKHTEHIELARHRIDKAKVILSEAKIMLEQGHPDASIGRSYYAIFTAARAALALKKLDSRKHSGVISLFNRYFIKDGILSAEMYKAISGAKALRERADYADYAAFSRDEAENQFKKAAMFIEKAGALIRQTR